MIRSRLILQTCRRQTRQRIVFRDNHARRPLLRQWNEILRPTVLPGPNYDTTRLFWSFLPSFSYGKEVVDGDDDSSRTKSNNVLPQQNNERMPQVTQLLDIKQYPIGSFRASTWIEAETCLRWASEERQDIPLSFTLLDRLVQEPDSRQVVTQDLLSSIVQIWSSTYTTRQKELFPRRSGGSGGPTSSSSYSKSQKEKSSKRDKPHHLYGVPTPQAVWRKLEAYQHYGMQLDNRMCYHVIESTVVAHCRKKPLRYPQLAESILERMLHVSRYENPLVRPSVATFNSVIASWQAVAQRHPREAPERSHNLLRKLKSLYEAGWGEEFMPDHMTYRRVMSQYAHLGEGDIVEELLEEMFDMYMETDQQYATLQPRLHHFTLVLIAWSKSKDPDAAQRATAILQRMLELEALSNGTTTKKKASTAVIPDDGQGNNNIKDDDDDDDDLPQLFNFKVYPSCFNIAMVCWSKQRTKEGAFEVQQIYEQLKELSQNDPRTKRPNEGTYSALIMAWHRFDPIKAEQYFWEWKDMHSQGLCDVPADTGSMFNILVDGLYRSGLPDATERCQQLFERVLDDDTGDLNTFWQPSGIGFSMVVSGWTRKKERKDMEQAESLLMQLEDYIQKQKNTTGNDLSASWLASLGASPTLMAYVPVIHGWAALGEPERAERLLRHWFSLYNADVPPKGEQKHNKRLDAGTFKKVLNSWLTKAVTQPDAADRAEDLLLSMREWRIPPHAAMFDTVLECRRRSHRDIGAPSISPRVDELIDYLDVLLSRGRMAGNNNSNHKQQRKTSFLSIRRTLLQGGGQGSR